MPEIPATWWYGLGSVLLILASVACWVATFFTLPGNWGIVALAALCAVVLPEQTNGLGVSWWAVGGLTVLALVGELLEFAAGAAGAARLGASRRSLTLSLIGATVGSVAGAIVGVPVPIVGPILAALGGGAVGAYVGAYLGEMWKGRSEAERLGISQAAFVGRLLGTLAKLVIGIAMVAYVAVESVWL